MEWYEYVGAFVALLVAARVVVVALKPFARLTKTKADDEALEKADELLAQAEKELKR